MHITVEELEQLLLPRSEHETLEFKEAKNQFDTTKLIKYCVAIANEGGGKLILGVSDKLPRQIVGTGAFQDQGDIKSKILDKLRLRVEIDEVLHPQGRVLIFQIPSRPIGFPLHCDGSYLMRSGEDLVPMTSEQLKKIFAEGAPGFFSQPACEVISANEVIARLNTHSYFKLANLPYPTHQVGVLEKFISEKLLHQVGDLFEITNLGAVLFANDLRDFDSIARKGPRVVVYEGKGKLITRSDHTLHRGYAVCFTDLLEYIQTQLPSNEVIGQALRGELTMYPPIVIRELVANALIHQDFTETGTGVMIEVYEDRIEITNPGLPFIQPDRFIDEYQSRNERLASLMRRLRICEEQGSGIDKVIHWVEVFQLPAPDFRLSERHTQAILFSHTELVDMDRNDKIRACYQHCCLKYVMNEKMTNQSLRERFKLNEDRNDVASRILRDTLNAGKIKISDPNSTSKRYSRYIPFWA